MNGETSLIVIFDTYTCMLHGDTRLSKSPPVKYWEFFLQQYSPEYRNKLVVLDQGGELYRNSKIHFLKQYQYEVYPTGADYGPVE